MFDAWSLQYTSNIETPAGPRVSRSECKILLILRAVSFLASHYLTWALLFLFVNKDKCSRLTPMHPLFPRVAERTKWDYVSELHLTWIWSDNFTSLENARHNPIISWILTSKSLLSNENSAWEMPRTKRYSFWPCRTHRLVRMCKFMAELRSDMAHRR